jgi:hypothetical protein
MKLRWFFFVFALVAMMTSPWNCVVAQDATTLLQDAFAKDSNLDTNLWTTSSTFLTDLANGFSSTWVTPQLSFDHDVSGMHMTGISQDGELTGVQALSTFSAPFHVVVFVTDVGGKANPFAIFLASSDLSQFLILHANQNPTYRGLWVNAPGVGPIYDLGEQFSPPIQPRVETLYKIVLSVDATGSGSATVEDVFASRILGTLSGLQAGGTGPYYLVLGQRIGLVAPTGSQVADWSYVRVTTP